MFRTKLDLCLSQIAIAALFVRAAFVARLIQSLFSATSLRLTFVDPVHSRGLSRPGKFRATCSSRARELSPSFTGIRARRAVNSSQKQLEIPSSERTNFSP